MVRMMTSPQSYYLIKKKICTSLNIFYFSAGPPAGLLPGHVSAAIIGGSIALVVGIGIGIVAIALYRKHKADSPPQTWGRITFENDGQQDVLKQD